MGLTYLGLALGYIPGLRMNQPTIALVGSAFLIALGVLNLREAWQAIDANTIVFLLCKFNDSRSICGFRIQTHFLGTSSLWCSTNFVDCNYYLFVD